MWYAKTKFYLHTRKLTLEDYADLIKLDIWGIIQYDIQKI